MNTLSYIADFYFSPVTTIKRMPERYLDFKISIGLFFLAALSGILSAHLSEKTILRPGGLIISGFLETTLSLLVIFVIASLFSYVFLLKNKNVMAGKLLFFSVLSFTPSILLTPFALLTTPFAPGLWDLILFVTVIYELVLYVTSIRTTCSASVWFTLLIFALPILLIMATITVIILLAAAIGL